MKSRIPRPINPEWCLFVFWVDPNRRWRRVQTDTTRKKGKKMDQRIWQTINVNESTEEKLCAGGNKCGCSFRCCVDWSVGWSCVCGRILLLIRRWRCRWDGKAKKTTNKRNKCRKVCDDKLRLMSKKVALRNEWQIRSYVKCDWSKVVKHAALLLKFCCRESKKKKDKNVKDGNEGKTIRVRCYRWQSRSGQVLRWSMWSMEKW